MINYYLLILIFINSERFVHIVMIEYGVWDAKDSNVFNANYLYIKNVINLVKKLVLMILSLLMISMVTHKQP
jgi:hypothetical protein